MRRGFSLIELLVVMAIIVILASILFPAFSKAREKGREATCLSNLHQIGLGISQYVQDYDGTYPCDSSDPNLWQGRHFRWLIMPYLGIGQKQTTPGGLDAASDDAKILTCPSDPVASQFNGTSYAYSAAFFFKASDLATVPHSAPWNVSALTPTAQSDFAVAYPSQKILAGEWGDNHDGQLSESWGWWTDQVALNTWHEFVFADGHARYVSSRRMVLGYDGFADPNDTVGGISGIDVR